MTEPAAANDHRSWGVVYPTISDSQYGTYADPEEVNADGETEARTMAVAISQTHGQALLLADNRRVAIYVNGQETEAPGHLTVHTQHELDAAIANVAVTSIVIDGHVGAHINVKRISAAQDKGQIKIIGRTEASIWDDIAEDITVHDNSTITVYGDVIIDAFNQAHVTADGPSFVHATDRVKVNLRGVAGASAKGEAEVYALGFGQVTATEKSRVVARGRTRVSANGNSYVEVHDDSAVVLHEQAIAVAHDTSSVTVESRHALAKAYGTTTVDAHYGRVILGQYAVVRRHSDDVQIKGTGTIVDVTSLGDTEKNVEAWAARYGATITDGRITLFKAVDSNLVAGQGYRPITYVIGENITALDWRPDNRCGGGLHLSPSITDAKTYRDRPGDRYLRVTTNAEDVRIIAGSGADAPKVKVQTLHVEAEVDRFGFDLPVADEATTTADETVS